MKSPVGEDANLLRAIVQQALQEILEAEMIETVGAEKSERTEGRQGYRSGYYRRSLVTRVGKIELRVPQDRAGRLSTEVVDRYQRSEKALATALMEMYVHGVLTRKVNAVAEEHCGHEFSASTISRLNAGLDEQLEKFATRRLEEEYPYLIVDARYERVREGSGPASRAVLIAIGIIWDGCREALTEAAWQRCFVHFLRNALDYLPKHGWEDCLMEFRWLYERRNAEAARRDLEAWLKRWQERFGKLCEWVEANIADTFTFYRLPEAHHKHLKSTNMLERLNQEIKRRTLLVRIFPNEASALRLVRALAVEIHEDWIEQHRYLNMALLKERKKQKSLEAAA